MDAANCESARFNDVFLKLAGRMRILDMEARCD
jgi:hypothetical protein